MENRQARPQLSFTEAVKSTWQNITNFKGRARRSELWWSFLVYAAVSAIGSSLLSDNIMVSLAFSIALYVWIAAVTVRRLQDNGHSAIWVIASILANLANSILMSTSGDLDLISAINVTPSEIIEVVSKPVYLVLGAISTISNLMILIFCLQDSDPLPNKYGESPKYC
ncbi:MAG: DUF805 domain-containing protein [Prevotella sp.]